MRGNTPAARMTHSKRGFPFSPESSAICVSAIPQSSCHLKMPVKLKLLKQTNYCISVHETLEYTTG